MNRPGVDLYWIPLGAGDRVVRVSGAVFEWLSARLQRRRPCRLYHSALELTAPEGRYVIEMTPVPDARGDTRGVVVEGPVGTRVAGRLRLFRYEIRRWRGGEIPDKDEAVAGPVRVSDDDATVQRLLELVPGVPPFVWGRDAVGAGDMWNSNSVVAWLLARSGVETAPIRPPCGGRAPGWTSGLALATGTARMEAGAGRTQT